MSGTITHQWADTYDFEVGGDFAAGALALEEAGRAKTYDFGAARKQDVTIVIEENDGEYTLKKVVWRDLEEGVEDGQGR